MSETSSADGEESEDSTEFAANIMEQTFELWVLPELRRRGLPDDPATVRKAFVQLRRDEPPTTLINDEFVIAARARVARDLEEGEPITAADIEDIEWFEPEDLDPDAAWLVYLALPDGRSYVRFDFTYDRSKALALIDHAEEYLASADSALSIGHERPAIELTYAAAELSVMAQMMLHVIPEDPKSKHKSRIQWLDQWARLGNVPGSHARAVQRLQQVRPFARYGTSDHPARPGEVAKLYRVTADIVKHARDRAAPPTL